MKKLTPQQVLKAKARERGLRGVRPRTAKESELVRRVMSQGHSLGVADAIVAAHRKYKNRKL
jgi:hypothetical protein